MALFTLGINHRTAPLTVREQVAFHAEELRRALADLSSSGRVVEAAILSTCNRTELYCQADDPAAAARWLSEYRRVPMGEIEPYLYTHPNREAVRHAFRVASGLDSMVLGEPQILGQMKEAVRIAREVGALGTTLNKLFQQSFSVAKDVRSTTAIGANIVSMAAASVHLAERIFGDDPRLSLAKNPVEALKDADALVIVTEWKEFRSPDFDTIKSELKNPLIFDGRNLYDPKFVRGMGIEYFAIGR